MKHIPVLLNEAIEGLDIRPGNIIVDATLGFGGHSGEICRRFGKAIKIVGIDLDTDALDAAKQVLVGCQAVFYNENFRNIDKVLTSAGIVSVDRILADFGLSSHELDESGRGFTFRKDEPLLMTFKNPSPSDLTAREILNTWQEESLADIIYGFGEERYARRIAKRIVETREEKPIETTFQLVEIVRQAVPTPYTRKKIHFATKTFQAIRIAVNDELRAIHEFLEKAFILLGPGGRLVTISFHSHEDRIVKRFFLDKKRAGVGEIITRKPITPTKDEIKNNPRSRSAKLRILKK